MAIESVGEQWIKAVLAGCLMSKEEISEEKSRAWLKARAKFQNDQFYRGGGLLSFRKLFLGEKRLEVFDRLNRYPHLAAAVQVASLIRRKSETGNAENIDKEPILV